MVNGDDYFDRMVSVEEEYQFAQRALHSFATTKETVDQFAHEELGSFHELLTNAPKKFGVANRKSLGFCARWHCSIFRICQGECTAPRREIENRMRQNHLILLVAITEEQLKTIQREILRHNLSLLSPDRQNFVGNAGCQGRRRGYRNRNRT